VTLIPDIKYLNNFVTVRFQVLTVANIKMTVFWEVAPCSLIEIERRFRGAYCLHRQGDVSSQLVNSSGQSPVPHFGDLDLWRISGTGTVLSPNTSVFPCQSNHQRSIHLTSSLSSGAGTIGTFETLVPRDCLTHSCHHYIAGSTGVAWSVTLASCTAEAAYTHNRPNWVVQRLWSH
jgi:hypothetical protein